jgi:hypothetical protein
MEDRTPGPGVDHGAFRSRTRSSILLGPVAYAVGAILAWASTAVAFVCYAAIAAYFVRPRDPGRRRTARA